MSYTDVVVFLRYDIVSDVLIAISCRRPSGDSDDDDNGDREMDENDMRDFKFEDQNFIPPSRWDL